jgi:hypothetical protein
VEFLSQINIQAQHKQEQIKEPTTRSLLFAALIANTIKKVTTKNDITLKKTYAF